MLYACQAQVAGSQVQVLQSWPAPLGSSLADACRATVTNAPSKQRHPLQRGLLGQDGEGFGIDRSLIPCSSTSSSAAMLVITSCTGQGWHLLSTLNHGLA